MAARLLPRVGELASRRAHVRRDRLAAVTGLLGTHLPNWRWRVPDGGPALWIELPGADARVFATIAMRQGVEVVPATRRIRAEPTTPTFGSRSPFPPTYSPRSWRGWHAAGTSSLGTGHWKRHDYQ